MASYARMQDRFADEHVSVAGISVDPVENNRAMVEKLDLWFPLLSDPDSKVISDWGVLNEREQNIAKPALFGIRRDGSIAYSYIGTDYADRPSDDELFAGLREVKSDGQR